MALVTLAVSSANAQTIKLKPVSSGMMPKMGGYIPQRLALSTTKPAGLNKMPAGVTNALYGTLTVGKKSFIVVVDEPATGAPTFYIDSNGNGNLTDDAKVQWKGVPYPGENNAQYTRYTGGGTIELPLGRGKMPASVQFYRFDPKDTARAALKDVVLYYSDYGWQGEADLHGKKYPIYISDDAMTGEITKDGKSPARMAIDRNGDGQITGRAESYDPRKPFTIDGNTYEIDKISLTGGTLTLKPSTEMVAEIPMPPDLSVGKKVPAFMATDMDGNKISFPETYKGKIVMLDFWATWCGPCIGELPNVTKAYDTYHGQGFEILGVTLDQVNMADKVKAFTKDKNMPWQQIYEGKYWDVSLVKNYGVEGIPFTLLVDGDTGIILADSRTMRGPILSDTIGKALKTKFGKH